MRNARRLLAGVAVASLALLSGCAGNDGSGDDSGGSGESFAETGGSDSAATAESVDQQVQPEQIDLRLELIKTARIALESGDVDAVLTDLDGVVVRYGGVLESEDVRTDDEGEIESASVVVRVPVDRFEDATDEIAGLATLVRERASTEDVTTRVADVDARVASAKRSLESLRRLFDRATRLADVIRLESELSQRQAELESLLAQQRSLARQTAMSTIHVSVDRADAARDRGDDRAGFLAGLERGWSGLVTFVSGTVHVIGLVLPMGTLALVVGAVGWLAVRRIRPADRA